ncbi:MAG TPA: hypothetical protein VKX33_04265 [Cyclobacteriaceae bacterium]|nr:hypothetical protein [Cyclobacteriaceae bacterium]
MKKIFLLAFAVGALVFQGCEGPMGPQGPQGPDGGIIVSSSFELELDFTAANQYEVREDYGFEVLPSDVVLVYILWENDGKEIWRLLPQSVFFQEGVLQYNFDFTDVDVKLFLDGTINFGTLEPEWTQDQVFRVVIVPADNVGRLDYSNYDAVTKMLGLEDEDFQKR